MIHLQYCVLSTEVDRKPFSLSFVNFLSSEDKGASISVCSWYLVYVFFPSLFWPQLMQTHAVVWSGQTVGTLVTSLKMATVKASIRQHSTCAQYAKTAALTNREASLSTPVCAHQFQSANSLFILICPTMPDGLSASYIPHLGLILQLLCLFSI